MTKIETTKQLLYYLGHDASGEPGETARSVSPALRLEVEALGREIAIAAAAGPVEIVATS